MYVSDISVQLQYRHILAPLCNGVMITFFTLQVETCRTEEVKVYCKCRPQDEGDMIYREQCQEWFHTTCEVIRDFASMKNCSWMCSSCSNTV